MKKVSLGLTDTSQIIMEDGGEAELETASKVYTVYGLLEQLGCLQQYKSARKKAQKQEESRFEGWTNDRKRDED
ncbi:hypothetical protein Tco_0971508 [Tanacetum coccineum]